MGNDPRPSSVRLEKLDYIEAILKVGWEADSSDYVFWRPDGPDGWRAFATCSDFFAWATADCEEIAPDDIPLLRQCLADLQNIEREYQGKVYDTLSRPERNDAIATVYLSELFASRKRKLRPMRCVYEDDHAIGPKLAELFDAAGPPRDDSEGKRKRLE